MINTMTNRRMLLLVALGAFGAGLVVARAESPTEANAGPVVRVGVLTDNYPFSFADPAGTVEGFAVDLLREIEALMALRLDRRLGPTHEINPALARGEIDLLQSFVQSEEREAQADFSVPYLRLNGAIFTRRDRADVGSLSDLRGRRVLVHRGSVGEQVLLAAGLADSVHHVDSVEQAFRWVAEGRGDATLASRLTGMATIHRLGLGTVVAADAPVPGYSVRYCFAVRTGDAHLLAQINEGLAILHSTGGYDVIYRRWFGRFEAARFTQEDVLWAVASGLALALGVACWAYVRQRALRRRISQQAEQLRARETRLRQVFEASPEALLVVSGDGAHLAACQLTEANPAALQLFGWERLPARGQSLGEIAPEQAALWSTLGESGTAELELAPVAGRVRCIHAARVQLETGHDHLLVLIDFTAVRRASDQLRQQEQQLRQAQKLEALGTLSSGIAHDFNNVLSVIIGNTQLAQMDGPAHSELGARLEAVMQASMRARDLVRRVLAFSRHAAPQRDTLALAPIVEETLKFIRAAAPSSIELAFRPVATQPRIQADATQVHQVLMNLCTNAVQALGRRPGRLELTEEVVHWPTGGAEPGWAELAPGDYVCLSVADTGPGIPAEVLPRVFEPFFTTKAPGEGTGLGLSVVHGIMRSHQGLVTVHSEPGHGAVFRLYFPLARVAPRRLSDPEPSPPCPAQRRVMLIDDEQAIVDPASELLRRVSCRVTAYTDPRAAVREFAAHPDAYDVVICDLTMPHLTGLDVVRQIRAHRRDVRIALASGFLGAQQRREAAECGVDLLIDKPLTREMLLQAIQPRAR